MQTPLTNGFSLNPFAQHLLDVFAGEWSSRMPSDSGLQTAPGNSLLFEDDRIRWAESQFGPWTGQRILELGPLEGGHSYMLHRSGASEVHSVEANPRAFLKCLTIKELFELDTVKFILEECQEFLNRSTSDYDTVIACGILYHLMAPVAALSRIAELTDRLFLWTHHFEESAIRSRPELTGSFCRSGFNRTRCHTGQSVSGQTGPTKLAPQDPYVRRYRAECRRVRWHAQSGRSNRPYENFI